MLLVRPREASALYGYGELLSAVTHLEPNPYGSEEPCIGLGITAAVRDAVAVVGATSRRIGWALTDVANERHRVDEWSYGMTRSHQALHPNAEHEQPLLNTGDIGAASAAMLLSIASVQWQTGCAHGDCVLIGTHSDGPMRGAMVARAK